MQSPSKNSCMRRVAGTRFRYEPYTASVIQRIAEDENESLQARNTPALTTNLKDSTVQGEAVSSHYLFIVTVAFKRSSAQFFSSVHLFLDDVVVVEGDRGEDIGIVRGIAENTGDDVHLPQVLRAATEEDLRTLKDQRHREYTALREIRATAKHIHFHAHVEDVEYQFDRRKLTVFVRRSVKQSYVDFRKLQRILFAEFRCRIWMVYIDELPEEFQCPTPPLVTEPTKCSAKKKRR